MPETTISPADFEALKAQLAQLTSVLGGLVGSGLPAPVPRGTPRSYAVEEVARMLGLKPFTVREWCRLGRCEAFKLPGWRSGPHVRWRVPAEEVGRLKDGGGLLPHDVDRNKGKVGVA